MLAAAAGCYFTVRLLAEAGANKEIMNKVRTRIVSGKMKNPFAMYCCF